MSIPRDVLAFLNNYPGQRSDPKATENLKFHSNSLRSRPDKLLIEEIHEKWFGDYTTLEYHHGFIQWLFPIQEYGMNYESQPLQPHEIVAMRAKPEILSRILKSYEMMLDFYGMRLVRSDSGLLDRANSEQKCAARYRNLVRSSHNYLRISRILKSLSEFGLEYLNAGFLLHVLNEQSEFNELNTQGIHSSMDRWWANCIRNEDERKWIGDIIRKVRAGGYTFTREMYEEALDRRTQTGNLAPAS